MNLNVNPEIAQLALEEVGITFLFAPDWHPAFKAIAPLRKILKVRTVFNLLGPLLNPLSPTGQVIGINPSCGLSNFRSKHPEGQAIAHKELAVALSATNTGYKFKRKINTET